MRQYKNMLKIENVLGCQYVPQGRKSHQRDKER